MAAYALSPIDLIPDFIPVLKYLDDLLIVPLGIILAVRVIPERLVIKFREAAALRMDRSVSRAGMAFVVIVWLAGTAGVVSGLPDPVRLG